MSRHPTWKRDTSGELTYVRPTRTERSKGGPRKRKHYSGAFRAITPLIKARDVVCAACEEPERLITNAAGKEMPTLIVHHIDEDSENNAPTNLITLCAECHNTHHKSAQTPFPFLPRLAHERTHAMPAHWHTRYTDALREHTDTS